jgi:hypothetical protein
LEEEQQCLAVLRPDRWMVFFGFYLKMNHCRTATPSGHWACTLGNRKRHNKEEYGKGFSQLQEARSD